MQNLIEQLAKKTMSLDEGNIISPYSRIDEQNFKGFQQPVKEAAVLVPFLERDETTHLVLTKRTLSLSNHKGQIAFPGGKIDKSDNSPSHAALRETEEEIGINQNQVKVLGKLPLYQTVTGYNITPIVGTLSPPFHFKKAAEEVDEIFELPFEFMSDVKNFKRESVIYEGERREFWALQYNDYYIWGATAAILRELAGRFEKV